jgi:hypothetical protein
MKKFNVILSNVKYDSEVDGEEVDVSHLPTLYATAVVAEDIQEAFDVARDELTDLTGFCLLSCGAMADQT